MCWHEPVDHLWASRVHFQNHLVFDKAGQVGMQEDAGLDHFLRKFVIYRESSRVNCQGLAPLKSAGT